MRDIEFRRPVECSILSERRVYQPYGMHGGEPASLGLNLWISKDEQGEERTVSMGGKNTVPMKTGGESHRRLRAADLEADLRSCRNHDTRRRRLWACWCCC